MSWSHLDIFDNSIVLIWADVLACQSTLQDLVQAGCGREDVVVSATPHRERTWHVELCTSSKLCCHLILKPVIKDTASVICIRLPSLAAHWLFSRHNGSWWMLESRIFPLPHRNLGNLMSRKDQNGEANGETNEGGEPNFPRHNFLTSVSCFSTTCSFKHSSAESNHILCLQLPKHPPPPQKKKIITIPLDLLFSPSSAVIQSQVILKESWLTGMSLLPGTACIVLWKLLFVSGIIWEQWNHNRTDATINCLV